MNKETLNIELMKQTLKNNEEKFKEYKKFYDDEFSNYDSRKFKELYLDLVLKTAGELVLLSTPAQSNDFYFLRDVLEATKLKTEAEDDKTVN